MTVIPCHSDDEVDKSACENRRRQPQQRHETERSLLSGGRERGGGRQRDEHAKQQKAPFQRKQFQKQILLGDASSQYFANAQHGARHQQRQSRRYDMERDIQEMIKAPHLQIHKGRWKKD